MTPEALTDGFLDRMRTEGDPLADECIERVFHRGQVPAVHEVMRALVRGVGVPTEDMPDEVEDYLRKVAEVPLPSAAARHTAQRAFAELGPEILMVLGFYALPASYAAKKGVKVLARTARLVDGPLRRVMETTQMVVDVMTPGGLEPDGRGLATLVKVRLMHAAVRHLLLHDPKTPWNREVDGLPINQEDFAGTMTTFSTLIIDGLERMNVPMASRDQEAWIQCWGGIARMLGLREELIPANVNESRWLKDKIQSRQIEPSPEGRELTVALLEMYDRIIPGRFMDGISSTLMRQFLPPDVADGLGVPKANYTRYIVWLMRQAAGLGVFRKTLLGRYRRFNLELIQAMLTLERGGTRPAFAIPTHLADGWQER
jgi:hypothetical protein